MSLDSVKKRFPEKPKDVHDTEKQGETTDEAADQLPEQEINEAALTAGGEHEGEGEGEGEGE